MSDSKVAAFFDVDETLVRGATVFWAARQMFRRQLFGLSDLLYAARQTFRYSVFGENEERVGSFGERAAQVMEGSALSEMQSIAEDLYKTYFVPRVYQATFDRLEAHKEAGHQVWLISATPWVIAEVIAKHLGAVAGIGTRVVVEDGRLSGSLDGKMMHGDAKAEAVAQLAIENDLDLDASWAYSDAASDIPMLSLVGNPVAVNPDRKLADYAYEHRWEVLNAREPGDQVKRLAIRAALGAGAGAAVWALSAHLQKRRRR